MGLYFKIKRAVACLLIHKKTALNLSEPVISFSFDDVPNSGLVNGAAILKKYGFRGTYYIALGLFDKSRPNGDYFDTAHLNKIVNDGGELACHTYDHIHLYTAKKKKS